MELSYDGNLLDAASMAARVSNPNFSTPAKWQQDILSQLNLHGEGAILKVLPTFFHYNLFVLFCDLIESKFKPIVCSIPV